MKKICLFLLYIFSSYVFSQTLTEETFPLSYEVSGKKLLQAPIPPPNPPIETPGNPGGGTLTPVEEVVPTINAEMEVNSGGALVYTLPIEIFPGTNNFQPNVALSYNSQSGNGQAGWGWNIIGMSVITQGGTSKDIEGLTRGPQLNDSDPFYLDGQRLIGSNTFETRLYSKVQILKDSGDGYSFTVKYPDGKIGKYKQLVYGQHYISTLVDALGNQVHYEYQVANNVPYIKNISYGGTSVSNDTYKIEFIYKTRKYTVRSWKNGQEYVNDKILSQVNVSSTQNGIHRKYSFSYGDLTNQNEKLVKVEVENGQGEKLKPLNFTYGNSSAAEIKRTNSNNSGLVFKDVESLGSVATGDFLNQGKPYPIYNVKTKAGYKILDPQKKNQVSLPSDNDTQLFVGKTLLKNGRIPENEQLIVVNTELLRDSYGQLQVHGEKVTNGTKVNDTDIFYNQIKVPTNGNNPEYLPDYNYLATPKIKIDISVYDPLTSQTRNVFFYAKGNYGIATFIWTN